ncbi:phage tail protein [Photobacterium sp. OFAV2-7]|uniref:phage tail-collar fiber domain-containing protein n=1 Tax=Photobacterium sp. OFAV2-7 TaxID=2917748 RepID=UPI001EF4C49A|nr:phage tail protein [Photobacterium sp. OFAV2-7]MCG7585447.1 phage tail protein [Photobacterium sp. OFAV2-7]
MTALVPENQQQYGSILTITGESAEQNSKVLKQSVEITHIAFGDANDSYVQPDRNATSLVNEIGRIPVNAVDVQQATPDSVPMLRVEAILPPDKYDLVIREFAAVATFNGKELYHAVGNCARLYVPKPANNGNMHTPITLEMFYVITSGEAIVEIDPRSVHASREWVKKTAVQYIENKIEVLNGVFEAGCIVKTLGYYSAFDGGEDEYVISKVKMHDLAFQTKNGLWANSQELKKKEVDIRKFGAIADWSSDGLGTDNYWVLQTLIDNDVNKLTGKGFFGLSKTVICRRNGIKLHSPSSDEFRFYANVANLHLFDVGTENLDEPGATVKYFTAKGVGFGSDSWLSNCYGIKTTNDEYLDIKKCVFTSLSKGLSMAEQANETSIKAKVDDNLFYHCGWGIYGGQTRVADMDMTKNTFQNPHQGAGYFGYLDGGTHSGNKVFNELAVENKGFQYIKPIWLKFNDNDLFELGGKGLEIQSPLNTTFNSNTFVKCGKINRAASISLVRFPITRRKMNSEFENTKIVSAYGSAVSISDLEGLQFKGTKIDGVGEGAESGPYDGFVVTNSDIELLDVQLDGQGSTSEAGKGRYWLNATNSTVAVRQQQKVINWTMGEYLYGTSEIFVSEGDSVRKISASITASLLDDKFVNDGELTSSAYINLLSAKRCPGKKYHLTKTDDSIYSMIFSAAPGENINGNPQMGVSTKYGSLVIESVSDGWIVLSAN